MTSLRNFILITLGLASRALPAMAVERQPQWLEIRSPHFVVVSNGDPAEARACVEQFERIRAAYRTILPDARVDPDKPILIAAVEGEQNLQTLLPQYWAQEGRVKPIGAFVAGVDKYFVIVRLDGKEEDVYRAVYHEYFHLLISLNLPPVPLWLHEGLAEFWSQTEFRGNEVKMGRASPTHVRLLRQKPLLPMKALLSIDTTSPQYSEATRASIFYAQSWALVHNIMLGDGEGRAQSKLKLFLSLLEDGVAQEEAFERTLGELSAWEGRLARYVRRSRFPLYEVKSPLRVEPRGFRTRGLSEAEALAIQGNFLALSGRLSDATLVIERALQSDPELALAHEGMGLVELTYRRSSEATRWFVSALERGSQNYFAHYRLGMDALDRRDGVGSLSRAEQHLEAALRLNPEFAPGYAALAEIHLRREGESEEALKLARKAMLLEPHRAKYRLDYGRMLVLLGRLEEARAAGTRALKLSQSLGERREASRFLEGLEAQAMEVGPHGL